MERNPNLCSQSCDLALTLPWLLTCGMFVWRGLATLDLFCVSSLPMCVCVCVDGMYKEVTINPHAIQRW